MEIFSKSSTLKNNKVITVLFIIFILSWIVIIFTHGHSEIKYKNLIQKAETLEKQQIYYDAQKSYMEAYELKASDKIAFKITELSKINDDEDNFMKYCNLVISKGKKKDEARLKKAKFYCENEKYKEAYKEIKEIKNLKSNREAQDLDKILDGKYYVKFLPYTKGERLIELKDKAYFTVISQKETSLVDDKAKVVLSKFDKIGEISKENELISGYKDKNYSYYDFNGNRRYKLMDIEYLGIYSDITPIMKDNTFSFLNVKNGEKFGDYTFASNFKNKKAMVLKDNAWYFIDDKGAIKNKLEGKDIRFSNNNFENFGYIIMKTDKFYIYDKNLKRVCDKPFDDIFPLIEDKGYFAARKNQKWGLIDSKGMTIVDFKYDEMHSSKNGYACAKKNGKWGYVKTDGREVIDFIFDSATDFSKSGKAIVNNSGSCMLITLCKKC